MGRQGEDPFLPLVLPSEAVHDLHLELVHEVEEDALLFKQKIVNERKGSQKHKSTEVSVGERGEPMETQ